MGSVLNDIKVENEIYSWWAVLWNGMKVNNGQ